MTTVIIQCAAKKKPYAGTMRTRDGRPVKFVAKLPARHDGQALFARPDDIADDYVTWRQKLVACNAASSNPYNLLRAFDLYDVPVYGRLATSFQTFILSAGWGLVRSDFLLPDYDITFSSSADVMSRRSKLDAWDDFNHLPNGDFVFFGGKAYYSLLRRLTWNRGGKKTLYYNSMSAPDMPGFECIRYDTNQKTNWHYACADAFIRGGGRVDI